MQVELPQATTPYSSWGTQVPKLRGNVSISTELFKQNPTLFDAHTKIHYAPTRYTRVGLRIYDPTDSSKEPGIFLTVASCFAKIDSIDKYDQLLDFLIEHRPTLQSQLDTAQRKHRAVVQAAAAAISIFNGVTHNSPVPPEGGPPADELRDGNESSDGGQ